MALLGGGLCLCDVVFGVFLVLKLIGQITWSWWWVTAPLWGQFAIGFVVLILWVVLFKIINLVQDARGLFGKNRNRL